MPKLEQGTDRGLDTDLKGMRSKVEIIVRGAKIGSERVNWRYAFTFPEFSEWLLEARYAKVSKGELARRFGLDNKALRHAIQQGMEHENETDERVFLEKMKSAAEEYEKSTTLEGKEGEAKLETMKARIRRCRRFGDRGISLDIFLADTDNRAFVIGLLREAHKETSNLEDACRMAMAKLGAETSARSLEDKASHLDDLIKLLEKERTDLPELP